MKCSGMWYTVGAWLHTVSASVGCKYIKQLVGINQYNKQFGPIQCILCIESSWFTFVISSETAVVANKLSKALKYTYVM